MRTPNELRKLTVTDMPVVDLLVLVALTTRAAMAMRVHDENHDWKTRAEAHRVVERAFAVLDDEPDHSSDGLAGPATMLPPAD